MNKKFRKANVLFVALSVLVLLLLMDAGVSNLALAQTSNQKIVMASTQQATSYYGKWIELTYAEAFRRLGMELEIKVYPPKRAELMLSEGQVDGDLGRVPAFHDANPQLIVVEEAPAFLKLVAFTTAPSIRIDGWESLRDTAYRVEYVRGVQAAEAMLPSLVKPENLSVVNNWIQAVRKLNAGRADVYIDFEGSVLPNLAANDELKDLEIHIAGILSELPVQAYLQPKHAGLAAQLSDMLKAMKDEGLIEKYRLMAIDAIGSEK